MTEPLATVVVAAYGRPDTLRCALESVRAQTVPDWKVLVVGDSAAPGTLDATVAAMSDPRFRFVNLPERQGEQSQPNSVGVALARTDVVALLNHDDLWLPDHLDRVLGTLAGPVDLCVTSAAFTWESEARDEGPAV